MRWSLLVCMVFAGVGLVAYAYVQAAGVPLAADADFSEYVRARGGLVSSGPGFPDAYRQMAASARLMQNAYLGGGGLVLFAAGCFGLAADLRRGGVLTEPGSVL